VKRICVFCGSSPGARPKYLQAAKQLGYTLASKKVGFVYGGAKVGMMGKIATAVLEKGGEVIGVIPKALLDNELAFTGLAICVEWARCTNERLSWQICLTALSPCLAGWVQSRNMLNWNITP
jgi:uncharacterized protein (TIGR00730 family)